MHDCCSGVASLQIEAISQANAIQRAGRAGRTQSGHCYRLFPESEFRKLEKVPTPEILRVPLPSICLSLKALGIGTTKYA